MRIRGVQHSFFENIMKYLLYNVTTRMIDVTPSLFKSCFKNFSFRRSHCYGNPSKWRLRIQISSVADWSVVILNTLRYKPASGAEKFSKWLRDQKWIPKRE